MKSPRLDPLRNFAKAFPLRNDRTSFLMYFRRLFRFVDKGVQIFAAFSLYHRDPAKRFLRPILQSCAPFQPFSSPEGSQPAGNGCSAYIVPTRVWKFAHPLHYNAILVS
jgi:hypothetical protein